MIPVFYVKNGKYVTDPMIKKETIEKQFKLAHEKTKQFLSRCAKIVLNKKS